MPTQLIQRGKMFFHPNTPPSVWQQLEKLHESRSTVRIWLGDTVTGRAWAEENDVKGKIGCSTGPQRVPLLIEAGEDGGPQMLDHCIVRIDVISRKALSKTEVNLQHPSAKTAVFGKTVYQHPSFHTGTWELAESDIPDYSAVVMHDGSVHARFKSNAKAEQYAKFMQGQSYSF